MNLADVRFPSLCYCYVVEQQLVAIVQNGAFYICCEQQVTLSTFNRQYSKIKDAQAILKFLQAKW